MWYVLVVYIIYLQLLTTATGSTENLGYRFEVHVVNKCPGNETAFEKAAEKMNCTGRYLCAPNKDLTSLIEFCTDRPKSLYLQGNCIRLDGTGDLNNFNCSNFISGCPAEPYTDDEIYKYPACLNISKDFGCYTSEEKCIPREIAINESKKETLTYFFWVIFFIIM
uniref:Uncharacterized protein LOC111108236 n=1 Tax=Crassostrea virginica TaxID=6565 RepID=A0A8B8B963_CRAVI|nr:uncharacterized protein LOC111108236 [Crassostrea virginica]